MNQRKNHIYPQALIKDGWKYPHQNELITLNSSQKIQKEGTKNLLSNYLVTDNTENCLKFNDIENKFIKLQRNNCINNAHKEIIYKYMSMQLSRSYATLSAFIEVMKKNKNIYTLLKEEDDLKILKEIYNKLIISFFYEYNDIFKNDSFQITTYEAKNFNQPFILGSFNILNASNMYLLFNHELFNILKKYFPNFPILTINLAILNYIEIYVISQDKLLFLYHPAIQNNEIQFIKNVIGINWNYFQLQIEPNKIILPTNENYQKKIIKISKLFSNNLQPTTLKNDLQILQKNFNKFKVA